MKVKAWMVSSVVFVSLSMSLMGCVSLVAGTATNATMRAGVVKAYVEKNDTDSIMVNIPLAKGLAGAMLHVEKITSRQDKSVAYKVRVEYLNSTYTMTPYESIQFKAGDTTVVLAGIVLPANYSYATAAFQGSKYGYEYLPKDQTANDPAVIDRLVTSVVTAKTLSVHNYEANSAKFISYDLTADEAALFSQLQ